MESPINDFHATQQQHSFHIQANTNAFFSKVRESLELFIIFSRQRSENTERNPQIDLEEESDELHVIELTYL